MKNKKFLTEADRKNIISEREKAILESFGKTFNKIKRIDENEVNENWEEEQKKKELQSTLSQANGSQPSAEEMSNVRSAMAMSNDKKINEYSDDDELDDEDRAEQAALVEKYKARILKNVPRFNEMAEKAVDGLGYPMEFKVYPTDPDLSEIYPIEIEGDKITISCGDFSDTYDLNNFNDYGDSYDPKLNYWFTRFYNLLKKGVTSLEGGQNYYKFYVIDIQDNNRILDGNYSREDAESEKRTSYYDEPGARVVSLKQLVAMGGKPLVIGGGNENNPVGNEGGELSEEVGNEGLVDDRATSAYSLVKQIGGILKDEIHTAPDEYGMTTPELVKTFLYNFDTVENDEGKIIGFRKGDLASFVARAKNYLMDNDLISLNDYTGEVDVKNSNSPEIANLLMGLENL